jgi:hypothetical protein
LDHAPVNTLLSLAGQLLALHRKLLERLAPWADPVAMREKEREARAQVELLVAECTPLPPALASLVAAVHRPVGLSVGQAFLDFEPLMGKLYGGYVRAHREAQVERGSSMHDAVEALDERTAAACKGVGYASLAIMPISRVPRYLLLLREALKCSEPESAEADTLAEAAQRLKATASGINRDLQLYEKARLGPW